MRLLELWVMAGQDAAAYWRQTPRIIKHAIAGYARREQAAYESLAAQALLAAKLDRWPDKRPLPSLKALIGQKRRNRSPQEPAELIANLRAWGRIASGRRTPPAPNP